MRGLNTQNGMTVWLNTCVPYSTTGKAGPMSIMLVVAAAALVLRILTYKLLPDSCRNIAITLIAESF
jgi:hypothetical protein